MRPNPLVQFTFGAPDNATILTPGSDHGPIAAVKRIPDHSWDFREYPVAFECMLQAWTNETVEQTRCIAQTEQCDQHAFSKPNGSFNEVRLVVRISRAGEHIRIQQKQDMKTTACAFVSDRSKLWSCLDAAARLRHARDHARDPQGPCPAQPCRPALPAARRPHVGRVRVWHLLHHGIGVPCWFGLFNIDRFTSINDNFSHGSGDKCCARRTRPATALHAMSNTWRARVRLVPGERFKSSASASIFYLSCNCWRETTLIE